MQVVDCGSQYTAKIHEFLRRNGYEIASDQSNALGIIISGGPCSAYEEIVFDKEILNSGKPILGICYGMQAMAHLLGGRVEACDRQYGPIQVEWLDDLLGLEKKTFNAWASHGDTVVELPPDFQILAKSGGAIAGMISNDRQRWGVQWHPEVSQTENGADLLHAFCKHCGLAPNPVQSTDEKIKELIAGLKPKALVAVSGGVDSTTLALLYQQSGLEFQPVLIDTGLMRENEIAEVSAALSKLLAKLLVVDASDRFLGALQGVADPDRKRQIIGKQFADLLKESAQEHHCEYLAQGTLFSDVIESGQSSSRSARIKRHHNLEIPTDYLPLVEPFRGLFKFEVREIARALGMPPQLTQRMPFPGPGLAVRIIGAVTAERLERVRQADAIFQQLLIESKAADQCSQAFAASLDCKAVGVAGDGQLYEEIICLRAVESIDFMTADVVDLPMALLKEVALRIQNQVRGVARVLYDLSTKPPATIEFE